MICFWRYWSGRNADSSLISTTSITVFLVIWRFVFFHVHFQFNLLFDFRFDFWCIKYAAEKQPASLIYPEKKRCIQRDKYINIAGVNLLHQQSVEFWPFLFFPLIFMNYIKTTTKNLYMLHQTQGYFLVISQKAKQ